MKKIKFKNIFNFCGHCYHSVKGSERKYQHLGSCKIRDPYICKNGGVMCNKEKKCCKCGKTKRTDIYLDFDTTRALKYRDIYDVVWPRC